MPTVVTSPRRLSAPPLPVLASLRLARPSDSWHKRAFSVLIAAGVPIVVLLAIGRLDLAMYTMGGSFCALYGHDLPYAARARTVAWVVAGMVAGSGAGLVTGALTDSLPVLIAVGSLLAAVQKTVCDGVRIGAPGPVILTFISSACLFADQPLGRVPELLLLTLVAGVLGWLVTLAPALLRRDGPERRATARALLAAARLIDAGPLHSPAVSRAADGADAAAWHALLAARPHDAARHTPLRRLLLHAETTAADPTAGPADAARLRSWARLLRRRGPVPIPAWDGLRGTAMEEQLLGIEAELAEARPHRARGPALRAFAPGSPLLPIALRTGLGCLLAGGAAAALGVGRPYWAIVTAAAIYQANVTLTWGRALQRVIGNALGVLLFAAAVPLIHLGPVALACCCLVLAFAAEAFITRNYWLGSLFVTPMALLITEFGRRQSSGGLIADRVLDTVTGAVFGLLAVVLVTNRRALARVPRLTAAADRARAETERHLAAGDPAPAALEAARRRLATALADLRAATDTAAGEWRHRTVAVPDVLRVEQAGHRTLAAAVRYRTRAHTAADTEGPRSDAAPRDTDAPAGRGGTAAA